MFTSFRLTRMFCLDARVFPTATELTFGCDAITRPGIFFLLIIGNRDGKRGGKKSMARCWLASLHALLSFSDPPYIAVWSRTSKRLRDEETNSLFSLYLFLRPNIYLRDNGRIGRINVICAVFHFPSLQLQTRQTMKLEEWLLFCYDLIFTQPPSVKNRPLKCSNCVHSNSSSSNTDARKQTTTTKKKKRDRNSIGKQLCDKVSWRRATMSDVFSDAHVKIVLVCVRKTGGGWHVFEDDDKRAGPSANQSSRWYRAGRRLFARFFPSLPTVASYHLLRLLCAPLSLCRDSVFSMS